MNKFVEYYEDEKREGKSFEEALGLTAVLIAANGTHDDLKAVASAHQNDVFNWFDKLEEEITNENNQAYQSIAQ